MYSLIYKVCYNNFLLFLQCQSSPLTYKERQCPPMLYNWHGTRLRIQGRVFRVMSSTTMTRISDKMSASRSHHPGIRIYWRTLHQIQCTTSGYRPSQHGARVPLLQPYRNAHLNMVGASYVVILFRLWKYIQYCLSTLLISEMAKYVINDNKCVLSIQFVKPKSVNFFSTLHSISS